MDANERYEADAAAFYRDTRMMAPDKDDPIGNHTDDERWDAWRDWLAKRKGE